MNGDTGYTKFVYRLFKYFLLLVNRFKPFQNKIPTQKVMIKLETYDIKKGDICEAIITHDLLKEYQQIQFEIYETGSLNPKLKLSFGQKSELIADNSCTVKFSTEHLSSGIYEIKYFVLHTLISDENSLENIHFTGGIDFNRLFFNISNESNGNLSNQLLTQKVIELEKEIEVNFLKGFDLSKGQNKNSFAVFVLIKGLKSGVRFRLPNYEFIPLNFGLQSIDELNATNKFLEIQTKLDLIFHYSDEVDQSSQQQFPIIVAHFPNIIADQDDVDEIRVFVENRVNVFLEAMSLVRGASGEIFDIVIYEFNSEFATRLSPNGSYVGNLLTGSFSGENPDALISQIEALEENKFLRFLVSLHKESINEKNEDYHFLRLWSILELLAESKNYFFERYNISLEDFDGSPLYELVNEEYVIDPKTNLKVVIKVRSAIAMVYNLFKEHGLGTAYENLEKINIWLSLRDSVAHFGSIENCEQLNNKQAREFAIKALMQIKLSKGHNPILWELKEDVKLLLQRELNVNSV